MAKRKDVSPRRSAARDKAAWLLYRYAEPRVRKSIDFRSMENGSAMDQAGLERARESAGHELLEELEQRAPAIAELLVAACMAGDQTGASSRAREGCRAIEDFRFPGDGIVVDAELV